MKYAEYHNKPTLRRRILSRLAAFALGAVCVAGFAPLYFWPLAALGIGGAYWALCSRGGFKDGYRLGFWWGAGYGIANFHWSLESIFANAEIARQLWWLYPIGFVGIMIASGILFGLPFAMTAGTKSRGWKRAVYFALAWTFTLWLSEWFLTGFPWNPLANMALPYPAVSGIMSVAGALGLTFILAGAIVSIPEYLATRSRLQFLFFIPLFAFPLLPDPNPPFAAADYYVRIIQPAFDMNQKFDKGAAAANIARLTELSNSPSTNAARKPDLIVWPETAYPYLMSGEVETMPPLDAPLVFGAVYYENGRLYNAMLMTGADGRIVDKYFKRHLVPFGEYRPFGDIIPTPGQLAAGYGPLRMMGGFAPAICYEIVFSDSLVVGDPRFILNITNDAWFGRSWGIPQHLDMARRQAIETGLPVVRANYSGISAIIDARGNVIKSLPLGTAGALDGAVPAARTTIYRRIGLNGTMLAIILMCSIILAAAYFYEHRKREGDS